MQKGTEDKKMVKDIVERESQPGVLKPSIYRKNQMTRYERDEANETQGDPACEGRSKMKVDLRLSTNGIYCALLFPTNRLPVSLRSRNRPMRSERQRQSTLPLP